MNATERSKVTDPRAKALIELGHLFELYMGAVQKNDAVASEIAWCACKRQMRLTGLIDEEENMQ